MTASVSPYSARLTQVDQQNAPKLSNRLRRLTRNQVIAIVAGAALLAATSYYAYQQANESESIRSAVTTMGRSLGQFCGRTIQMISNAPSFNETVNHVSAQLTQAYNQTVPYLAEKLIEVGVLDAPPPPPPAPVPAPVAPPVAPPTAPPSFFDYLG